MAQKINAVQFRNPTGVILPFAGLTVPTGYLQCDGSAVSRTTYADLFNSLNVAVGTFTVTIASPGVFTRTAHGFVSGEAVYLTTTGALPTGLSQNTVYYVNVINANTFNLSTNRTNVGAIHINTSGTQSGTHTISRSPYGVGNGTTTFSYCFTSCRCCYTGRWTTFNFWYCW